MSLVSSKHNTFYSNQYFRPMSKTTSENTKTTQDKKFGAHTVKFSFLSSNSIFSPRGGKITQKYRDYAIFLWKCLTRKFLSAVLAFMKVRMNDLGTFFEQATPQGTPVGAAARLRSPTSVTCSTSRRSPGARRRPSHPPPPGGVTLWKLLG